MRDGELDRLDPLEIGLIHGVLATRTAMCLLAERLLQRRRDMVEDRHGGQALLRADLFQPGTRVRIDEREEDQAGICLEFGHDPFEMLPAPDHRPEMAHHVRILELRERGLGQHL